MFTADSGHNWRVASKDHCVVAADAWKWNAFLPASFETSVLENRSPARYAQLDVNIAVNRLR
jgi:hypothetical protein